MKFLFKHLIPHTSCLRWETRNVPRPTSHRRLVVLHVYTSPLWTGSKQDVSTSTRTKATMLYFKTSIQTSENRSSPTVKINYLRLKWNITVVYSENQMTYLNIMCGQTVRYLSKWYTELSQRFKWLICKQCGVKVEFNKCIPKTI